MPCGAGNWSNRFRSALRERTASRFCGRMANASSAGDGARTATAATARCWPCCPPRSARPPPILDRLAHEYELRDELDAAWAARPLALAREGGRTALLLEDPGGEPLERLIGAPMELGTLPAPRHRHRRGARQGAPARPRPQGRQAGQHPGELRRRTGAAHRVRHRLASAARASGARAARSHRRHARLYGARTDRADEPLDRFPQRPLRARRHASTRCSPAVCRSAPPIRWNGFTAISRGSRLRLRNGWRASRPSSPGS